jgi:hypothetical protein
MQTLSDTENPLVQALQVSYELQLTQLLIEQLMQAFESKLFPAGQVHLPFLT